MRYASAAILLTLLTLAAPGCGGGRDDSTPVACLKGREAYLAALAKAPGEVLLAGETPISDCLAENQQGGDLATVGEATIETATALNTEARRVPSGRAALELGYLVGAARRGAAETAGIHSDLLRRLTVAARYAPGREPLSPAFLRGYREGFDAGRATG